MQRFMGHVEEELKRIEDQLYLTELERDKAFEESRGLKKVAQHAALELLNRDRAFESLRAEKDSTIEKLRSDLRERDRHVSELEEELERGKENGTKMFDSLLTQMKQLEDAQLEVESLKEELKRIRAKNECDEETSKRALDELALALKEVMTEASQTKAELGATKAELEHSRGEEERLHNMAERLRLEAEDTLLAWNDKETGLVECLRQAEDEKRRAVHDSSNLRDILKQALRESSAAKADTAKLRDQIALLNAAAKTTIQQLHHVVDANDHGDSEIEAVNDHDHDVGSVTHVNVVNEHDESVTHVVNDHEESALKGLNMDHSAVDLDETSISLANPKKRALLRRFGDLLLIRRRPLQSQPSPSNY